MLPVDSKNITGWSLPVKRYKELIYFNDTLPLVVGGYRNKQASILDRKHEIVSISAAWIKDDENLNIDWILKKEELNLSAKDTKQPKLNETNDLFEFGVNYYA